MNNEKKMPGSKPIAIITGAAGGIGRKICQKLAASGYQICVSDLNNDAVQEVVSELTSVDGQAFGVHGDLAEQETIASIGVAVRERGNIKLLVNNLGVASAPSLDAASDSDWDRALLLNLTVAKRMFDEFSEDMKNQQNAVVVNISSCNGYRYFGNPAYSVAKAGLSHLTCMIAAEYGRYGIRAVTLSPASVQTAAWDERLKKNPKIFDQLRKWYPLDRIVQPEEVADVVRFVASEDASAITGSEIFVDCGFMVGNIVLSADVGEHDT